MDQRLVPVIAVLSIVALALIVMLVRRFVPVKREIRDDFFGTNPEPRATTPTQPDPEEIAAPHPLDPNTTATVGHPALARPAPEPPAPEPDADKCCACGQPADPTLIELEDWQQVNRVTGAVLAFFGVRTRVAPGRRLYVARSWCRSCAAIADFLNARFERDEAARAAAARRIWERRGLVDAVKQHIADADGRYDDERRRLERANRPWRNE